MPRKPAVPKKRSEKLSSKLLEIRLRLSESQNGILKRLGLADEFGREYVSKWENGVQEPPLPVLCAYADVANVYVDVLIRDVLELPIEIPAKTRSAGLAIK